MLVLSDLSREGGILEDGDYQFVVNTDEPGIIRMAIYSASEVVTGQGLLITANFTVRETKPSSVLRLERFDCNELPVSVPECKNCIFASKASLKLALPNPESEHDEITGGFYFNGALFREASVRIEGYYDVNFYDLDGDGRIGLEDAVRALLENDIYGAIRALQCLTGMPF